jgi:aspartokinase/homoserine dehydrogenase 1
MTSGINVISPSRQVLSGPLERYRRVEEASRANAALWQFESSVGCALPVLTTLKDLLETGDTVPSCRSPPR